MNTLFLYKPLGNLSRNGNYAILHSSDAGWSSLAARRAHNPKVVGSNPAPATKYNWSIAFALGQFYFVLIWHHSTSQNTNRIKKRIQNTEVSLSSRKPNKGMVKRNRCKWSVTINQLG
jgi:hypothetical protein